MPITPHEAGLAFVTPSAYADEEYFDECCAVLRREDPIHLVEHPAFAPFHVLTKHADVFDIEVHHDAWHNAPRPVIASLEADRRREEQGEMLRTLIHMDLPDHRRYRELGATFFLPKTLAASKIVSASSLVHRWRRWSNTAASATSPATSPCSTRCK